MNKLKEQYPVTAHVPNLDFRTECREFKRCEESQRTLKNPFASRFAEFDTTRNFSELQINDIVFPLTGVQFGQNRDFLAFLSLPLAGGTREGKRFNSS